jgi:TPR repeat protein
MWEQGLGTDADPAEALRYYKAGAQRDNARCMVGLSRFLKMGIATGQDRQAAAKWFALVATRGDNDAVFELARAYLFAEGVDEDQGRALALLREAASNGHATGSE